MTSRPYIIILYEWIRSTKWWCNSHFLPPETAAVVSDTKIHKGRVGFNGIHDSYFTILIDCSFYFDLPTCIINNYSSLWSPCTTTHTQKHTIACTHMISSSTSTQMSLWVVTFTGAHYLLWYGGAGAEDQTRCDWIWKVPIQVMPTGYLASTVQQHQQYTARRKVSRISSVPPYLHLPALN